MGIKSTVTLTRPAALELRGRLRAKLGIERELTDSELGDELDALRELECQREGVPCFDNYLVREP